MRPLQNIQSSEMHMPQLVVFVHMLFGPSLTDLHYSYVEIIPLPKMVILQVFKHQTLTLDTKLFITCFIAGCTGILPQNSV